MEKITDVLKELERVTCRELAVYFDLTAPEMLARLMGTGARRQSAKPEWLLDAWWKYRARSGNQQTHRTGYQTAPVSAGWRLV